MDPIPAIIFLSLRRSRVRARVLLALAVLRRSYVALIASTSDTSWSRARCALLGRLPDYRTDLALVRLGLVRPCEDGWYEITELGVRVAVELLGFTVNEPPPGRSGPSPRSPHGSARPPQHPAPLGEAQRRILIVPSIGLALAPTWPVIAA